MRFIPLNHIRLSHPGYSRLQVGRMLSVASSGRFIAASAYVDHLAIFSVSISESGDMIGKDSRKLEQIYCDPVQRLVADFILIDDDTAFVSDRKGSVVVLSCANHSEDNASPERNVTLSCSYYIGEIAMRMRKGSFSYKLPADDELRAVMLLVVKINSTRNYIMASTLLGSIIIFIPSTRNLLFARRNMSF